MSQSLTTFAPLGASETVTRTFNFAAGLAKGETLQGTPVCVISVLSGTDGAPASRLLGGPTIIGATVTILIGGMVAGVTYQLLVEVGTSAGQTLSCWSPQSCFGP